MMSEEIAELYTDGSCHTQQKLGTWVAIVFTDKGKKVLSGTVKDTTHNRMELTAVLNALEYIKTHHENITTINVYTDSQYVTGLPVRKKKITAADFSVGTGNIMQNADLVNGFFETLQGLTIELVKVKAHQKKTDEINYNREADMLSRKLLRNAVEEIVV